MLQLRLLGRFDLRRDDGIAVSLPGRQSMAVLACLGLADDFTLALILNAECIGGPVGFRCPNRVRCDVNGD